MFYLFRLLDSDQQPLDALSMCSSQHMQIPGTMSQFCRITCQQPQGDTQIKTNLSFLWQHQRSAAGPRGQRRTSGLHPDTMGLDTWDLTPLPSVPGLQLTAHLTAGARTLTLQDWGKTAERVIRVMEGTQTPSDGNVG